eukprot:11227721-Lingulodinium_polyedra.AAC.1
MSRALLVRQPRGGLPGLKPEDRLLARVPVYGTQDVGRGFWNKVPSHVSRRRVARKHGIEGRVHIDFQRRS